MSAPVQYIRGLTERYKSLGYEPYRWFKAESEPPWQPLRKPLAKARIGMLSTAGAYALGQVAYHYKDDSSIREIPASTPDANMRFAHVTENYLVDPRRDPACVFPLQTLHRLREENFIGEIPDAVFSCMGGVYSQRRTREELAPALLAAFKRQQVDAVLLVPMCPVCHQSACIISRHLEANGIPTVCLASALDIVESGRAPRVAFVDYPLGHTAGKPFDRADQLDVVRSALLCLVSASKPGELKILPNRWAASDEWKEHAGRTRGEDTRKPRDTTPQFQLPADRDAALASGALAAP